MQEAVLSQRLAKYITWYRLAWGIIGLFCNILCECTWPQQNFFFFVATLQPCENCEPHASVCLVMKRIVIESSVDDVPSQ